LQPIASRRIAPILGSLGALATLAIDMYLPGMPRIAADLHAGEGAVQFSLMTFFAGLMIGQLFCGPLSDRIGRKPTIYAGLALFVAAALGCASAATPEQLIAWRFVQGLGGSVGMAISMAIIRDLYTGHAAARLMGLMMMALSVAPVIAPLLGTAILAFAPWPALFVLLAIVGAGCALLVATVLPETRPPALRTATRPADVARNYLHLIVSRRYIAYVGVMAVAQAGFFAYLAGSSFVFISVHGLTPAAYSLIFAMNAVGLTAGAQLAPRLMHRFAPQTIVRAALAVYAAAAVILALLELGGGAGIVALAALLFVAITALAFVMPLNSMMALESYGAISGTAAALMGTIQFAAGTLASLIVGLTADGTALPMVLTIAVSGIAACLLAFGVFPRARVFELQKEPAS
jgi:DHA1 family bicyclomycin/chloramphenicol resistance-like MFS transporter